MSHIQESNAHTADAESLLPTRSERDDTATTGTQDHQQPLVVVEIEKAQKPTRAKKSVLWNFFEEVEIPSKKKRGEIEQKVKCKSCGTLLTKNASGTTTHWKRHLESCDLFKHQQKSKQQKIINYRSNEEVEGDVEIPFVVNPGYYDSARIRELVCKLIIVHELPFRIVEYQWFNILLKALNPSYQKVSRNTIRSDCMKHYESEKETLKKVFRNVKKMSLTCDFWTSNQTICYMSLVAHYIDDDWKMHCRGVNFIELEPPHSGVVISNAIYDCLAAWKIEDKVASITFDNAASNDLAVKFLLAKFTNRKALWFEGKFLHVRCCAHILNLIVQDGLKIIRPLIDKVGETIKYIKKSNSRYYKFQNDIDSLNLGRNKGMVLDCCTRWGSIFKMLDSAFHYRAAIDAYASGDANYRWQPSDEEWLLYEEVNAILGVFHSATEQFSGSTYPTSNLFYPHIVNIKKILGQLKQSNKDCLRIMANAMVEKFDKYWGPEYNTLFAIAAVLDPRFKMDLKRYLNISMDKFDILGWWKMNELKYLAVAKMAKDIFTIPITSASSESAFSTGGRVVDDYHSSLLPSMVQALVCTSSWIRGGHHKEKDLEDDANSIPLVSVEANS